MGPFSEFLWGYCGYCVNESGCSVMNFVGHTYKHIADVKPLSKDFSDDTERNSSDGVD